MDFDPAELDALSREDLILRARARGVERPEQMTRVELRDEIVRMSEPDLERQRRSRGWLGVARDLLASVVESGLNLPDAAAAIRGDAKSDIDFQGPPPVATVTLAEIYATQGHYEQALRMLEEVIEREPEHATARALHQRLSDERDLGPGRRRRVVPTTTATPAAPAVEPAHVPAASPEATRAAAPEPARPVAPEPPPAPPEPAVVAAPEPPPAAPEPAVVAAPEPPPAPPEPAVAAPEPPPAPRELTVVAAPEPPPAAPEGVVEQEGGASPDAADVSTAAAPVLPARVVLLQTPDRAFVYWRLPSLSESLRLRSVAVRPSADGPAVAEEDFVLPVASGGFWLPRHERGTEVRAAIGELSPQGFTPLAVARVLSDEPDETFEPPGVVADESLETAARSAAGW